MYGYIMQRTQISLTEEHRRILDDESARTGRSISALIRDAIAETYGEKRDTAEAIRVIREASGTWKDRDFDGATYVEGLRSGRRLREAMER